MEAHQLIKKCCLMTLPIGARMLRLNPSGYPSALHYGKDGLFRWDAYDQGYGVLYAAKELDTAFAETFGHDVATGYGLGEDKFIETTDLDSRTIFELHAQRALTLVDMTGATLTRLNMDSAFIATADYTLAQSLSRAAYEGGHDGIVYHSRAYPSGTAYALFDRVQGDIGEVSLGCATVWSDPIDGRTIYNILESQGWSLVGNHP
jgi:hypothetical protein